MNVNIILLVFSKNDTDRLFRMEENEGVIPKMEYEDEEVCAILHLCLGNIEVARLFVRSLPPRVVDSVFGTLLTTEPPRQWVKTESIPNSMRFRWTVSRLILDSCPDSHIVAETDLSHIIRMELTSYQSLTAMRFTKAIVDKNLGKNEKSILKLCQLLLSFCQDSPSYGRWWRSKMSHLILKVPFPRLYSQFGFQAFNLIKDFGKIEDDAIFIDFTNHEDLKTFYTNPSAYITGKYAVTFQNGITKKHPYPDPKPFSEDVSLVNTSYLSSVYFVDLVTNSARRYFRYNQIKYCYKSMEILKEMQPWIFIYLTKDLLERFPTYYEGIKDEVIDTTTSAGDYLCRLRNEFRIFTNIRRLTGQCPTSEDLKQHSFPFLLEGCLKHRIADAFEGIDECIMYSINDSDRMADNLFIWAYYAISAAVLLVSQSKIPNSNFENEITIIEFYLAKLQEENEEVLSRVILDIFTLLFIQKENKYLCSKFAAEFLITTLLNNNVNREFTKIAQKANFKIHLSRMFTDSELLESVLMPMNTLLFMSLKKKDWTIADRIASSDQSYSNIVQVYQGVSNYIDTKKREEDEIMEVGIEIGLSFKDQESTLNNLLEKIDKESLLLKCILNRIKEETYSFDIKPLIEKLSDKAINSWPIPSIEEKCGNFLHLFSFFTYLDDLVPILLNGEESALSDLLRTNPYVSLTNALMEGEIDKAKKLAEKIHVDIHKKIINDTIYPPHVIEYFTKEDPVVTLACYVQSTRKEPIEIENVYLQRMLSKQTRMKEDYHSKLKYALTGKLNESLLIELSYMMDDFQSLIEPYINEDTIIQFADVLPFCAVDYMFLRKCQILSTIKKKGISPYPIISAFRVLLQKKLWRDAHKLCKYCRQEFSARSIILDYALTNPDEQLLTIDPTLREEIEQIIPKPVESKELAPQEEMQNYINDIPKLSQLLEENKEIDFDDQIIQHIKTCSQNLHEFLKMMRKYEFLFRKQQRWDDLMKQEIIRNVKKTKVTDSHTEDVALNDLRLILSTLNTPIDIDFDNDLVYETKTDSPALYSGESKSIQILSSIMSTDPIISKIQCLYLFTNENLFKRYGITYSFNEFEGLRFANSLLEICTKYDFVRLIKGISIAWVASTEYSANITLLDIYKLSLYDEKPVFQTSERFTSDFSEEVVYFMSKPQFMSPELINEAKLYVSASKQSSFPSKNFEENKLLFHRIKQFKKLKRPEEQLRALDHFLKKHSSLQAAVNYYAGQRDFESAVHFLGKTNDPTKLFAELFGLALATNSLKQLKDSMLKKNQQELMQTLSRYTNGINYLDLEIKQFMDDHVETGITAIGLYVKTYSIEFLVIAHMSISLELNERDNGKKKIGKSDEELRNLLFEIELQRQFHMYCEENGIPTNKLIIFDSNNSRCAIVLLLFEYMEFVISLQLIEYYKLDLSDISKSLLSKLTAPQLLFFLKNLYDKTNEQTFSELVYQLIMYVPSNALLHVIQKGVLYSRFRCVLLIQFGFLDEALDLAIKDHHIELVPLIGHQAQNESKINIVNRSKQYLESTKRK